jgi:molybdopterin/thiamine biosynthesis adenylyltransferase
MSSMDFTRQLDLVPIDGLRRLEIDAIGAGGIVSWAVFALAKLGVGSIRVWDDDTVEPVNVPSQMYSVGHARAGVAKVEALQALCREFADAEIEAVRERVTDQRLRAIVISGLDSMKSRRTVWEGAIRNRPIDWYLDARMGGHSLMILTVRPTSPVERSVYEDEALYSDEEALPLPCTGRALVSWPLVASALIVRQIVTIASGTEPARRIDAYLGENPFIEEG